MKYLYHILIVSVLLIFGVLYWHFDQAPVLEPAAVDPDAIPKPIEALVDESKHKPETEVNTFTVPSLKSGEMDASGNPPKSSLVLSEAVGSVEVLGPDLKGATASVIDLIPDWLLQHGDVRREQILLGGKLVARVRSRHEWEDGSQVEIEVTDLGDEATEDQFKSLGFDLDLEQEDTELSFRAIYDGDEYVSNIEYDENDGTGYVQYIVAGRYLMEVQIEGLPYQAFQALEDRDGLLSELLKKNEASAPSTIQ